MATKDSLSLQTDKKTSFDTGVIDSNNQYSNLNLNQNNLSSTNEVVPSRSKSVQNEVKNVPAYGKTNLLAAVLFYTQFLAIKLTAASKKLTNVENDTKKMDTLKLKHDDKKFGNIFENQESKQTLFSSTSSKSDVKNSSTLSLHIAAYENSIESSSTGETSEEKKATSKVKNVKQVFTSVCQSLYEIPRMQQDGSSNTPEVQQFKARQRLLFQPSQASAAAINPVQIRPDRAAAIPLHIRPAQSAAVNPGQGRPAQSAAVNPGSGQGRPDQSAAANPVQGRPDGTAANPVQIPPAQSAANPGHGRPDDDDDSSDEDDEPPTEQQKREEKFRGMLDIAEAILQQPNFDIQSFNNEFNRRCAGRIEGKKFLGSWVQHIRAVRDRWVRNGNNFVNVDDERFANIRRRFDPTYCVVLQIETGNPNQSLQNNIDDQRRTNATEIQNGGNVQTMDSSNDAVYLNNSGRPSRACTRSFQSTAGSSTATPSNRRKPDRRTLRKRPPIGSLIGAAVSRLPLPPRIVRPVGRPLLHILNNQVRPSPVISIPAYRPSQPYSYILGTRAQSGPLNPPSSARAQLQRADDVPPPPSPRRSPPAASSSSASLGNNIPSDGTAQLGNVGASANPATTASATVSVASSPVNAPHYNHNVVAPAQAQPQNDGHPGIADNQPPQNGRSEVSEQQECVIPSTPESQQQFSGPPPPQQQQINGQPPQQQQRIDGQPPPQQFNGPPPPQQQQIGGQPPPRQDQANAVQPAQADDQPQNNVPDIRPIIGLFYDLTRAINGQIDFINKL